MAKRCPGMKQIDRRMSVTPLMDWTDNPNLFRCINSLREGPTERSESVITKFRGLVCTGGICVVTAPITPSFEAQEVDALRRPILNGPGADALLGEYPSISLAHVYAQRQK